MLTFDAPSHTYRWNDTVWPSVTQVLQGLVDYARIPPGHLERARQEGNAIHEMVALDAAGTLDVDNLPEWLLPRWKVWHDFQKQTGFTPIFSERRVLSMRHRFAGTLDLFGRFLSGGHAVLDVKRSLYAGRVIGLQTAGYRLALEHEGIACARKAKRFALVLNDTTYRLEPFNSPTDESEFLSCLVYHRLKESLQ